MPVLDPDDVGWRRAFELAWESFACGSRGIGAVLIDQSGSVVAEGRNRWLEEQAPVGQLAGTPLAHAEVNAIADLGAADVSGLTLRTTRQPCVLCAAACSFVKVPRVEYASEDPIWAGVDRIHQATPMLAERAPTTVAVTHPVLSPFAALLPLTKALEVFGPESRVARSAAQHSPHLLSLA